MPLLAFAGGSDLDSGLNSWMTPLSMAGALTLRQHKKIGLAISMARCLAERARPFSLPRGRRKNPELPATPEEIKAMRGFCGNSTGHAEKACPTARAAYPP
eukprot:90917-Pyramimonas_sp.AAC.1